MRTYCIAQGTLLDALGDLSGMEIQKRGDTGMCIADSLCCMVETSTTQLNSNKFFLEKVCSQSLTWNASLHRFHF